MAAIDEGACGLLSLPNEILLNVLGLFSTESVLTFGPVCHRLYGLIQRLLLHRLQVATALDGHMLFLECGHPSAKWTTSKVYCNFLAAQGLQELISDMRDNGVRVGHHAVKAAELYCRFKPMNKEPDFISIRRPHPAGDVPGSRTFVTPETAAAKAALLSDPSAAVTRTITVDSHELFSQLSTVGYLGRREPLRGLLGSIQEVCDGTIRVWRDWLSKHCQSKRWTDGEPIVIHHEGESAKGKARSGSLAAGMHPRDDPSILWVNNTRGEQVGLKLKVKEQKWQRDNPILFASDIEVPVSYLVELEEVVVSTTFLLLKIEKARAQNLNQSGKAIIFGNFIDQDR
ncbi:uncharacterized protein RCC_05377 [Ramularia collo-cygni]|uniref:F-box domain-containing protein n=1 Tax=Ramularia collo-cygni TaxID=112498 RepID=A0A2D3V7H7_9PEZI|nr:uncharacterized protein RCC_05377 [Ramularia collo-cygni]CZT19526.1 uncharacterized protein RCC_05377 [Ramularia collo-cygni]